MTSEHIAAIAASLREDDASFEICLGLAIVFVDCKVDFSFNAFMLACGHA